MAKAVPVESAVGKELAYDTTVVNSEKAGVLLGKGHIITAGDIELLKMSGLYVVYVNSDSGDDIFESKIAEMVAMASADSKSVEIKLGKQGSALLFSKFPGIVNVNGEMVKTVNMSGTALIITRKNHDAVGSGELIGVIDSIPLYEKKERIDALMRKISISVSVMPFKRKAAGLVVTGTEVYEGKKKDLYTDIILKKAGKYGWNIVFRKLVPDDQALIAEAIREARIAGAEAIIITGGMSVDPTDRTPAAISSVGAKIVAYGIPVKPTTMSLIAYWDGLPVFGISAGGIYYKDVNSFDVVFTLMMAGIELTPDMVAMMGNGGLLPNFNPAFKLH
ncbi:MAG: molybdopterin-binding protein [Nitrososphaeria archaeon]